MTRKHFRRLISGIYLISTGIGISISLIALYSKLGSDYSTPLTWLAVFEFWTLLLPALVTCIIVGLVRLTNKIEPLSEEERQQSFVERLSKTQLFIPLSLLLAVPSAFLASTIPDIWIRGFFRVFSIFIAVHLFITWLLVLLLRRTTRIRKTGWKIVLILLFILSTIAYILGLDHRMRPRLDRRILLVGIASPLDIGQPGIYGIGRAARNPGLPRRRGSRE